MHPGVAETPNCTTYTSTSAAVAIPEVAGAAQMTLTVPGMPRIEDLDVSVEIQHSFMSDLDVSLTTPDGHTIALFDDVGSGGVPIYDRLNITLDDEAARPPAYGDELDGLTVQPEGLYRLRWLDGIDAGGTWTLTVRDDADDDGGMIESFALTVCEPAVPAVCSGTATTPFTTDFEADDGGFTHSGTSDDWERGTPTFAPLVGCNSGTSCWKTISTARTT